MLSEESKEKEKDKFNEKCQICRKERKTKVVST
jgi:hypothetical protein